MTQTDRDRLVALQKGKKGLITQKAAEIGQSERHVRRLLKKLKGGKGDAAVLHGLRGRRSNRKIDEKVKQSAITILGRTRSTAAYADWPGASGTGYRLDRRPLATPRDARKRWSS